MERRLAAILVADVVGYSHLMGADEEGILHRMWVDGTDFRWSNGPAVAKAA